MGYTLSVYTYWLYPSLSVEPNQSLGKAHEMPMFIEKNLHFMSSDEEMSSSSEP